MNMILIKELNQIINLEHVVDISYEPAHDFIDDEFETLGAPVRTLHADALLILTTTALMLKTVEQYDGAFVGVVATSKLIIIRGRVAEIVFDLLTSMCSVQVI